MSPAKDKNAKTIEPAAAKKAKSVKQKKHKEDAVELPMLVEIGFSFSSVFLILVDVVVAYVSYSAGANWQAIFLRVVISTVAVGFLLWLLSMNISNGSIFAALKTIEEEQEEKEKIKAGHAAAEQNKSAVTEA